MHVHWDQAVACFSWFTLGLWVSSQGKRWRMIAIVMWLTIFIVLGIGVFLLPES